MSNSRAKLMSDAPVADIGPLDIRRSAMDLLAFREHSMQELITKLLRKFPGCEHIDSQLQQLATENLQSDQRFAEAFVRSRVYKGQGPLRIRNELRQRGIASTLIELTLEQAGVDWFAVISELSARKYGDAPVRDEKDKAKRIRFFQYRGFSYELIKHTLDG